MSNAVVGLTPAQSAETSLEQAVCVEGLRLKYPGEDRLMFKDLSFSAARGEKVLLLGPSGCGKSTLLQVLSGMIPRATEVPMKCEVQRVPDSWGYVFQDPDTQFCMPYVDEELAFVLENLSVPREEMRERMQAALEEVGLDLDELHMPITHLSQGMKQRLYGVSRGSAAQSYDMLMAEGYVVSRPGSGTYVAEGIIRTDQPPIAEQSPILSAWGIISNGKKIDDILRSLA